MENKMMEGINENVVVGGVTNSKGGLVAKLAVGALGVAAGIGAVLFLKKKKNQNNEADFVEAEIDDVNGNE